LRKRYITLVSLFAVAMLSVAGCGSNEDSTVTASTTQAPAVVETEQATETVTESVAVPTTEISTEKATETVDSSDAVDSTESTQSTEAEKKSTKLYKVKKYKKAKTMYATSNVNKRKKPTADSAKKGSLAYGDEVTVTGKVTSYDGEDCLWYQLSDGTFVAGSYFSDTKPAAQSSSSSNSSSSSKSSGSSSSSSSSNSSSSSSSSSSKKDNSSSSSGSSNSDPFSDESKAERAAEEDEIDFSDYDYSNVQDY
jgi:hypothetical protein